MDLKIIIYLERMLLDF